MAKLADLIMNGLHERMEMGTLFFLNREMLKEKVHNERFSAAYTTPDIDALHQFRFSDFFFLAYD